MVWYVNCFDFVDSVGGNGCLYCLVEVVGCYCGWFGVDIWCGGICDYFLWCVWNFLEWLDCVGCFGGDVCCSDWFVVIVCLFLGF